MNLLSTNFLLISLLLVTSGTTKSDQSTNTIKADLMIDTGPMDVGLVCVGATVTVSCYADFLFMFHYEQQSFNQNFSLLITDQDGRQQLLNDSGSNVANRRYGRTWTLSSDESMLGKTLNYTCIYGALTTNSNDSSSVEKCKATDEGVLVTTPCVLKMARELRLTFQQCTTDDAEQYVVWWGDRVQLHCNGHLDNAKVFWFRDGQHRSDWNKPSLNLGQVGRMDAGVYSCYSVNDTTGYANLHHIDLDVLEKLQSPQNFTVEAKPTGLAVGWTSVMSYMDRQLRPRPRTVKVTHTVWYAPFLRKNETFSNSGWKTVNVTNVNNILLTDVQHSDVYAVTGQSSYETSRRTSAKITKLVWSNGREEGAVELRMKFGEQFHFECGGDRYRLIFRAPHTVSRLCYDAAGQAIEASRSVKDGLAIVPPEVRCRYTCIGLVSPFPDGNDSVSGIGFQWRFVADVTLLEPNPALPTLENLRCKSPGRSTFSITWSSQSSAKFNLTVILSGNGKRRVFNTNLTAKTLQFNDLEPGTSYRVDMAADDGVSPGRVITRYCSTVKDELLRE